MISVSVVSHGHGQMVSPLVESLLNCPLVAQVLVTINVPEDLLLPADDRIVLFRNDVAVGFGANHNAAFRECNQPFFCVVNPDIQLLNDPFLFLIKILADTDSAMAAPLILDRDGNVEDSLRRFPTFGSLVAKAFGGDYGRYLVGVGDPVFHPDWAAGMFMLFRSADFESLRGFDKRYFLYYEDVDICVRIWNMNKKVVACPVVSVIHEAQRCSHHNLRFMRWHLLSMLRYFLTHRHWIARNLNP